MNSSLIEKAKKMEMKRMNRDLADRFKGSSNGERCTCPICHYSSKKNKFSAVIFTDGISKTLKCFACGEWRRIEG